MHNYILGDLNIYCRAYSWHAYMPRFPIDFGIGGMLKEVGGYMVPKLPLVGGGGGGGSVDVPL